MERSQAGFLDNGFRAECSRRGAPGPVRLRTSAPSPRKLNPISLALRLFFVFICRFDGVRARRLQPRGAPASETDALQASQFSVGSREACAREFF